MEVSLLFSYPGWLQLLSLTSAVQWKNLCIGSLQPTSTLPVQNSTGSATQGSKLETQLNSCSYYSMFTQVLHSVRVVEVVVLWRYLSVRIRQFHTSAHRSSIAWLALSPEATSCLVSALFLSQSFQPQSICCTLNALYQSCLSMGWCHLSQHVSMGPDQELFYGQCID